MRVRVRAHSLVLPSDTAVWPSVHTLRAPGHVRHSLRCAWACPDPAGQRCPVRAQRLLKRRRRPRQHSAATVCSRTDPLRARALPGGPRPASNVKTSMNRAWRGSRKSLLTSIALHASRTELLSASVRPPLREGEGRHRGGSEPRSSRCERLPSAPRQPSLPCHPGSFLPRVRVPFSLLSSSFPKLR